jgi:hypothetical protein
VTTLRYDVLWNDRGAERGMRNLGQATDKTSGRMRGLKVAGAAALAAVGVAAVKFGDDSVRAYVAAESSQVRLQNAFQKFPKLADTNIGSLRKLNTELARKTRFDDDATASGQAVLAQFKLTGTQITQLTPLLQDYAAKTGKDLPTAAKDLGKAMLGQGRSLKNVGINFKDTGTQSGNLDQIMRGLRTQVGGFAEKEGKTAAGQSAILKNQFGELQEMAGQKLLPGLLKLGGGLLKIVTSVQDGSGAFGSFKRIVSATFGSFSESVGLGRVSFRGFADFVQTNQANITRGFVAGGKIVLAFGQAFAIIGSAALRSFAFIADGQADMVQNLTRSFRNILTGALIAFGWIPGVGNRLREADAKFASFSDTAVGGLRRAAAGARTAADGIDTKLRPALDKAGRKLDEVGRKEIWTAKNRDAAARASNAIRDIGIKADGSQVKLKSWNERTRLGSVEQRALEGRIRAARARMIEQRETAIRAGATQGELTKRWNQGREALYKEFRQMGLSSKAARELADRYGRIPKKVRTPVTQPGMDPALNKTKALGRRIGELPNKTITTTIKWRTNVDGYKTSFVGEYFGKRAAGGPITNLSGRGRRGKDTEPILAAVDEHMWTDKEVAAVGGHGAMYRMRKDALAGRIKGYAEGGPINRRITAGVRGGFPRVDVSTERMIQYAARRMTQYAGQELKKGIATAAGSSASWRGGSFRGLDASQMGIAATIASVGASMGKKAQLIGLIAGLVESRLRNVNYGDRDSLGVFQQRAPWGPASVRRNVRLSAGMFFRGGRGGQRGLDDISGWQGMSPGRAAQRVQVSAFPGRYATQVPLGQAILNALAASPGGGISGSQSGFTRFRGGLLTNLAAANMRLAERRAGVAFRVFQGGWRPRTSFSGTSHAGDAVDTQASARVIRAIRSVGWASGDRTGLGNWPSHAHSIPGPGRGRARGSAVWQWTDYVRRGGSRQGLRSPWGLERGGLLTARVAERGPERILSARQTTAFERMVRVAETRGAGGAASSARPITIALDLGDGVTQRVQGILDENDGFRASVGRMSR